MSLIDPALDNNVGANWCTSTTPFGDGDLGTPGAANNCEPPTEYNVTVTVVGDGVVNNTPGNPYAYGQTATLEPDADPGWSFDGWSGSDVGDLVDNGDGTWDLLMDEDKSVTATFTEDEYAVTVTIVGDGVVNNTPGNPYAYGQTATLEPDADPGWSFDGWSGSDVGDLVDNGDGTWDLLMDEDKSVTATFTEVLPETGSITIIKDADPADGTDFGFTSDIPGGESFILDDELGQTDEFSDTITFADIPVGEHIITETVSSGWVLFGDVSCAGGNHSPIGDGVVRVQLGDGEDIICTFTNIKEQPPTASLTVIKNVVNDNGGTAVVSDFSLFIDGNPVTSGASNTVGVGTHTVSETPLPGYVGTISGDCDASGSVTVAQGENKTCTITNNDQAASLTVKKVVINDHGGTAVSSDFTMNVAGTNVSNNSFPGDAGGTTVTLDAGSYTVSESGPTGYDATFDGCAGTIGVGESKTCTITNDDIAPTCYALTLSHSGQGSNPVAAPSNSTGCGAGQYVAGEVISLSGAVPVSGWEISGWSGTANDSSTASTNSLTMPASAHSASVIYTPTCYALTLSHSGQGSNPVAAPSNSTGCGAGQYVAGEVISLSGAVPDSGWEISGWSGTADDSSTASSNSLTMPAGAHSASVIYTEILPAQSSIDLEKFTNGHDADTVPGPNIPIGDPVEWTYEIENTGSLPLTAISLVDDPQGTITCDEGVIPDLDPGESFTCTTSNTAIAGQYVNTATVTAKDPDNNSVSDQDQSHYFGIDPTEWAFECTEHRMEVTGVGMGNQTSVINPQSLTLADPNKVNWLLAQMSGRAFLDNGSGVPDQVTFSTDASQTKVLNTANSFTNDFGYTFETTLQPTTVISVEVDGIGSANYLTPRALVLYSNRTMDSDLDTWTSAGRTTNGHVWQGAGVVSHTEVIDMPALPEPRDLTVTAVYIDNNNDSRPIVIEAEAGGVSASATHLTATDGDLLNIVNLTLTDVPTDTDQVTITIHSPKPDNGDSASLVGVNARYVCDNDLDDDTILNNIEGGDDPDGDQLPNYLDVESDGDLILDEVEWNSDANGDGQIDALDRDADQDGIFNFLDLDSDSDGLTDEEEGLADANENGILDFLEAKNPGGEGGAGPIYLPLIIKK
jgi:hypothetical protein